MTRPYASHVSFRFHSGQSISVNCMDLLHEMSMVGLMSHIAIIDRVALNRRSMSMKISFTRDSFISVPGDMKSIPDNYELSLRIIKPLISGNIYRMHCSPEIISLHIDGSSESVLIALNDDVQLGRLEISFSSLSITAHVPNEVQENRLMELTDGFRMTKE